MIELRIGGAELQAMIGAKLRARLRKTGFSMGASEAEEPPSFLLPVNLDLAGHVSCFFDQETGDMVFRQDTGDINKRLADAQAAADAVVANRPESG